MKSKCKKISYLTNISFYIVYYQSGKLLLQIIKKTFHFHFFLNIQMLRNCKTLNSEKKIIEF